MQAVIHWLQKQVLPGFEGVSLYDSMNFFRKEIFATRFVTRANSIAYSFIMAMPPLLLFFFTLIPYLPLPEQKIISSIKEILNLLSPNPHIKKSIMKVITDFITHKKTVLLSFSVLLTLFYSSNGMMGLMNNFDKQLPGFKQRNGMTRRVYAIALTLLLIAVILLVIALLIFQTWFAKSSGWSILRNLLFLKSSTYLLIILFILLTVCSIYKFGIAAHDRVRFFSPGALIATFLIVFLTALFFYAVNNLVNYDKIYGSIGTLIIFMLWINFMAQILLIGFELNASIIANRGSHEN